LIYCTAASHLRVFVVVSLEVHGEVNSDGACSVVIVGGDSILIIIALDRKGLAIVVDISSSCEPICAHIVNVVTQDVEVNSEVLKLCSCVDVIQSGVLHWDDVALVHVQVEIISFSSQR